MYLIITTTIEGKYFGYIILDTFCKFQTRSMLR